MVIRKTILIIICLIIPLSTSAVTIESLAQKIEELRAQLEQLKNLIDILYGPIEEGELLSNEDLRQVISLGVDWFKNAQEGNGHFKYEYLPYEDIYLEDDNIVRQAGSLFVLGEILIRDTNNVYELEDNIKKSISYFENESVIGEHNGIEFQCITNGYKCKLGATSLTLVGILDLIECDPALENIYKPVIEDYINYILAMNIEDKGFRTHFYPSRETQSDKESSYATGEALLALVRYYKYHPTQDIKEIIDQTFEYISNELDFDVALYLWATAAIKDMHQIWPRDEYVDYIDEYTQWRVEGFKNRKNTNHNMCAYLEGVVSAYSLIEQHGEEIDYWLAKNSQLQITQGNKKAIGGFLTGKKELTQRIDFTQHCISSYLQKLVDIDNLDL